MSAYSPSEKAHAHALKLLDKIPLIDGHNDLPWIIHTHPERPQPRRDRDLGNGMSVSIGRIRSCPVNDLRMVVLSHNTIRGAAGGAILNAELLVAAGYAGK